MRHTFVAVYIYEHTFPPFFSSFFSLVSVHAPTYGLLVRIYLFILSPCCRLIVCPLHTSLKSVHFTAPSYRLTASPPLRFILVYTPYFVINTRTHIVSAPTPSMCLRTSCIPCCCSLLLVSPSSGTIFAQALYTTDTCEIYLTLAGCEIAIFAGSAK